MNDPQDFLTKKSEHAARARRARRAVQPQPSEEPADTYSAAVQSPVYTASPQNQEYFPPAQANSQAEIQPQRNSEIAEYQPAERIRIPVPEVRQFQARPSAERQSELSAYEPPAPATAPVETASANDVARYEPAEPIRMPAERATAAPQKLWIPPTTASIATENAATDATVEVRSPAEPTRIARGMERDIGPVAPQKLWIPPATAAMPTQNAETAATLAVSQQGLSNAPDTSMSIRYVPNATTNDRFAGAAEALAAAGKPVTDTYHSVQYTPSAQEAAPAQVYTRPGQSRKQSAAAVSSQSRSHHGEPAGDPGRADG